MYQDRLSRKSPHPSPLPRGEGAGTLHAFLRVAALAAAGLSAYLAIASLYAGPVGCGPGSACAQVLGSRWSHLLGLPVGALAMLLYLSVFALTFTKARAALACCGVILVAAAAWFIALQVFVLHALCPWCMAGHALGLIVAGLILIEARPRLPGVALAIVPVAAMSLVQVWQPGADVRATGASVNLNDPPVLGALDAPHRLVLLYDYSCPHCRRTHGFMLEALERYRGEISVAMLPTPLSSRCNPNWSPEADEPRFEHSCDLARAALAVWQAAPQQFPSFDAWLFESEHPRLAGEATAKANGMVGESAYRAALATGYTDRQIAANTAVFAEHNLRTLPAIIGTTPESKQGIVVRVETADDLFTLLESRLGVRAGG